MAKLHRKILGYDNSCIVKTSESSQSGVFVFFGIELITSNHFRVGSRSLWRYAVRLCRTAPGVGESPDNQRA